MTKMTTEEAFVKVLQSHGIEHSFGIIGSAFMPISDYFLQQVLFFGMLLMSLTAVLLQMVTQELLEKCQWLLPRMDQVLQD